MLAKEICEAKRKEKINKLKGILQLLDKTKDDDIDPDLEKTKDIE